MGQQGLPRLLLIEFLEDGLDLGAEGQVFRQFPNGLLLVDGNILFVHVVLVARPCLGKVMDEAHPEHLQFVRGGVEFAEGITDENGSQDMFCDGFFSGTEKPKPRARGFVQHAHFE